MDAAVAASIRTQLSDRRHRLERAVADVGRADDLVRLLRAVDEAIERLDAGRFGRCEVCHESVDDELLLTHPLAKYCLCGLSPRQQAALERDLELARKVQIGLLPRQNVSVGGWDVHFRYIPAGPVSGDYLDVISRNHGSDDAYFLLGDVSGKGVAASLLMARLSALLRSLVENGPPVGELVARANRHFSESDVSSHFVTLVCARATPSGRIDFCNAGHCPPLVVRGSAVEMLGSHGFPVGVVAEGRYEVQSLAIEPGDTVVLYSDGISEAMNDAREQYGVERLAACVQNSRGLQPAGLAAACLRDVEAFRGGAAAHDDTSLMVIRRT